MALEKLTCKGCGGNDFRREGNYYICNYCGTKHILTDDDDDSTVHINININFEDKPKPTNIPQNAPQNISPTIPKKAIVKEVPSEKPKRKGCLGCLAFLAFLFLVVTILAVVTGESHVTDNSSLRDSHMTDMALLQKEGHPRLLSTRQSVVDFYKGYGNIVKLDKEYDDNTVLHVETYEQDMTKASWVSDGEETSSDKSSSRKLIDDIQISFSHMKDKSSISPEEALQLANSFMPWDLIDTYYELSEAVSYRERDKTDSDFTYFVIYGLKDKYTYSNYARQEHGLPISMGIKISTDPTGAITHMRIQIAPRVDWRRYEAQPWKTPSLHEVPLDVSWKSVSWQLLTEGERPKLLGDYNAMLTFGKKFPVEAVDISCNKESAISYGLRERKQLFTVDGRKHKDESSYVFEIKFDFTQLQPEKQVPLAEAIEMMKGFMPYDLLDRYYTLNFSRKISPTNRNTDGSIRYEVVYDRVMTEANRAEINKLEIPENIKIELKTDEDGNALEASLNRYRYLPSVKGRYRELLKNEYGSIREIYDPGRELGPYESGDEYHDIEPWENPF